MTDMTENATPSIIDRINGYLTMGGFFNPELANHDRVRDLIIDCRTELASAKEEVSALKVERDEYKIGAHEGRKAQEKYMEICAQLTALKVDAEPVAWLEHDLDGKIIVIIQWPSGFFKTVPISSATKGKS